MSKLIYRTKPPKKGYINHESFMTHEGKGLKDTFPSAEIQKKAMDILNESMQELIGKLTEIGYNQTKVGFYIHYNN